MCRASLAAPIGVEAQELHGCAVVEDEAHAQACGRAVRLDDDLVARQRRIQVIHRRRLFPSSLQESGPQQEGVGAAVVGINSAQHLKEAIAVGAM